MVSEEISERVRIVRHETLRRRVGGEEIVLYRGEQDYLLLNPVLGTVDRHPNNSLIPSLLRGNVIAMGPCSVGGTRESRSRAGGSLDTHNQPDVRCAAKPTTLPSQAGGDMTMSVSEASAAAYHCTQDRSWGQGEVTPTSSGQLSMSEGYKRCFMSPPSSRPSTRSDSCRTGKERDELGAFTHRCSEDVTRLR